ncbi:MAG: hypothetical protein GYA17_14515 [Chloroflexi bacterium]|nr:hypothetical protein [Anaerolineaceae bacterium]NMB89569.1 hypothetical protein [Chloroflexota bacterium]
MAARQELLIASPWLNAAGSLGFTPPAGWNWPEPPGAFITHPLSLSARQPAVRRGVIHYPGGSLLHSGLPNPGLSAALQRYGERWAHASLPVWVHLFGGTPAEVAGLARTLEDVEGVAAIELGIPPGCSRQQATELVSAALGELPLIVQVALDRAGEDWLRGLGRLDVCAISLGAPYGSLPAPSAPLSGRLYGPSLLPLAFQALKTARRWDLPVIAGGGVYRLEDGRALLEAGAWAVQLDTVLWG